MNVLFLKTQCLTLDVTLDRRRLHAEPLAKKRPRQKLGQRKRVIFLPIISRQCWNSTKVFILRPVWKRDFGTLFVYRYANIASKKKCTILYTSADLICELTPFSNACWPYDAHKDRNGVFPI